MSSQDASERKVSEPDLLKTTRRTFVKAVVALTAVLAISNETQLFRTSSPATAQTTETVLTCCHDGGPFYAHIVDGRWVKTTPIKPNLSVANMGYAVRNRIYSPDRIMYPMRRADFDPSGNRNPQNRGKSGYVRITWNEALDTVANELRRVIDKYGASAILKPPISHRWAGAIHTPGTINGAPGVPSVSGPASRFFALLGGCTISEGDQSTGGWTGGGGVTWGFPAQCAPISSTNTADIIQNTKLLIYWSNDPASHTYWHNKQNNWLQSFKKAGIKQIVIDPYFNDTCALYCDKWMAIQPGTDEAMMAAIAYTWITEGLHDPAFLATHTIGFDKFRDYILGVSDGVPKTAEWAAPICGIDSQEILALAHEWASKPTYVQTGFAGLGPGCFVGGANRRDNGGEYARMLITLTALLGNLGLPGRGLGSLSYNLAGTGQGSVTAVPGMPNPVKQTIRHSKFAEAVLNGSATWTQVSPADGTILQMNYPLAGYSQVKLIAFCGGSGMLFSFPNTPELARGLQSPNIEFIFTQTPWWEGTPKFADVILPARHVGERDDMMTWENYAVYMHTVAEPLGEPKNDFDIYIELATRLGIKDGVTMGKTVDQWLTDGYATLKVPLSFDEFKQKGYYEFTIPADVPTVAPSWTAFRADPTKNKLNTPSGLIEIYSQRVADFFGPNNPAAPTIPKYIPSPEGLDAPLASNYPLYVTSPHPKFGRHSQWHNVAWSRDEYQARISGYEMVRINPVDAKARGIKTGDVVRLYNDRGAILCGANVTQRMRPGVIQVWDYGVYTPLNPGNPDSLDAGGDVHVVLPSRQPEPLVQGMIVGCRVQVAKWSGS